MNHPKSDTDWLQLVETRDFGDLVTVVAELTAELGARFPESIRNWCGIGDRPYPLDYWRVFLVRVGHDPGGIIGLFRKKPEEGQLAWVGWFGIRPRFRGKGYGRAALRRLVDLARLDDLLELWAYTDANNQSAISTYEAVGFERQYLALDPETGQSADPHGQVLKLSLRA